uniref:(northern house mosquito) hypothetical protein n=1 Tax=Culex pipiens TaxID=7175 RepID=A0A8D8JVM0_CULPI
MVLLVRFLGGGIKIWCHILVDANGLTCFKFWEIPEKSRASRTSEANYVHISVTTCSSVSEGPKICLICTKHGEYLYHYLYGIFFVKNFFLTCILNNLMTTLNADMQLGRNAKLHIKNTQERAKERRFFA